MNGTSKNLQVLISICCIPVLFICSLDASAHPHVFINTHVTVVFDEKGLAGFQFRWLFDEMSGSAFIMDYDANKDGIIDKREGKILKAQAFDNMRTYHYMTFVSIDKKEFAVQYIEDFYALVEDGILSYNFFVPCHVTAISMNKEVSVSVYDNDFFIDYSLNNDIHFQGTDSIIYAFKTKKNLNKSYYFDQLHPTEIIISFKKK
jgi:ABC-type uncharacterized transport system substrate-binding protein